MAAQLCRKLVLIWTFRAAPGHVGCGRSPVYRMLRDKQPKVFLFRNLCSINDHNSEPTAGQRRTGREEMLNSLVDMGFTEAEVEELARRTLGSRPDHTVTQHLSVLTVLVALGFNPSSVLKIMGKCPELYQVKGALLQQRVDNLRKLGLVEGSLQRVVRHYPQLLTLPVKRVNGVSRFLREKCHLTAQQVTDVLRDSAAVVLEDMDKLEYKFQYAYFRMGLGQAEMVKSGLFRVSLEEVRCRHGFLERRGLYQTPDKKGQTRIVNPKLKDFLAVPEDTFLSKVALATGVEFEVFRKLMDREIQEEEEPEFSGSDIDDEKGYESEDKGSAGYRKRRKK
ncbi:transcription termination factor 4, mitochondrial [Anguilla anguilla]|uniref:transcription termination factor 4, mitochondrial n=1 Tax=Anguilla anguilla TaxID=7936 RepID=UPI0015B070D7|nr:transcription termination factor 4, mitochondrial [Anguilla anguilla]